MRFDMTGFVPLFFISVISGLTAGPPSPCAPSRLVSLALIARLPNCGVSRRAMHGCHRSDSRCDELRAASRWIAPMSAWDGVYVPLSFPLVSSIKFALHLDAVVADVGTAFEP